MDFSKIIKRINDNCGLICFKQPQEAELKYLKNLNLPEDVKSFYLKHSPVDTIEINNIRLLTISEIIKENTDYTPGYILTPLGFCVVASTIEGDVYCTRKMANEYFILIASHDEIYEGQNVNETLSGTIKVADTFFDFLSAFVNEELAISFYDLEE